MFVGPEGDTFIFSTYWGAPETKIDGIPEGFWVAAWDIKSGEQIYRIDGAHGEGLSWLGVTPDHRIALIATSEGYGFSEDLFAEILGHTGSSRLLIADLETGEILSEPELDQLTGNNYIESMAINPAGDQAFAILTDVDDPANVTGIFISLPTGEVGAEVTFDTDAYSARYSPDGTHIVVAQVGQGQSYFTLLATATGESIRDLGNPNDGHLGALYPNSIAFTPDGKRLVSGGTGGQVLVWDVETGEIIQRLIGHAGQTIFTVTISPDGQTAISAGSGGVGSLRFWDIAQDTGAQLFEEHDAEHIYDVAISPDGTMALSTAIFSQDGDGDEAILWDTQTLEVIHRLPGFFPTALFLPDGRSAILGGIVDGDLENLEVLLVHWDLESGEVLAGTNTGVFMAIGDIVLSPDGHSFWFVGNTNNMYQYNIETLTQMNRLTTNNDVEWLLSVAFSPDGQTALVGGDLGDIILFDLVTGEEIRRYNQGSTTIGLEFSEDGEQFVSASSDQTLVLWDVATGEAIQTFNGHTNIVEDVSFTADETQIISASADGTLILWDVDSGEPLRTFSEHGVWINELTLSPDRKVAYSAADDGRVIARPIAPLSIDEILAHVAEYRVVREFTCVERKQYRIFPLCDADGLVPDSGN